MISHTYRYELLSIEVDSTTKEIDLKATDVPRAILLKRDIASVAMDTFRKRANTNHLFTVPWHVVSESLNRKKERTRLAVIDKSYNSG